MNQDLSIEQALPVNDMTVKQLRAAGYAVVIWTPEEIGDSDVSGLEDVMIERGSYYLGD